MTIATNPVTTLHAGRKGPRPITAEDLWSLPRVGAPVPAADGAWCVVPVTTSDLEKNQSRTRLWRVPAGGGEPVALTSDDLSSTEPALSPDGTRLAFVRKGENGRGQIQVLPLDGGEARCVTNLPLGAFDPKWLPDGSGLVCGAMLVNGHLTAEATKAELERREKDPVKAHVTEDRFYRFWDQWLTTGEVPHLFHVDLASGALRDITPESTTWFEWMDLCGHYDISPDGREIAFDGLTWNAAEQIVQSTIYTVPIAGGPVTPLRTGQPASDVHPRYTPDGTAIVFGATRDPDFYADRVQLVRYDRARRTFTDIVTGWDRSPITWTFAADGTVVLLAEDRARVIPFVVRGTGAPQPLTTTGAASGLEVAGGRVFYTHQTLAQPAEAYAAPLAGGAPQRLTTFTEAGLAQFALGEVREMHFEGARGATVQMYVVLPPGYKEGERRPLLKVVHGGPHGISGDIFHMRWNPQLFAAPGYVVALVNFQGSTSWGQDFAKIIQGAWADRPFEDTMRAVDALIAAGLVNEDRMAMAGGSYGGYMAAWIAGHTDRFKCIVNHAGVYDALGQYASDWTMGRGKAWGGEAFTNLAAIDSCNPARYASGMNTPMLVIHGEKDYRVPVNHGLQCYGTLKAKGVPARLVYFPDENHWILKPRNSMLWNREIHEWLARWLSRGE